MSWERRFCFLRLPRARVFTACVCVIFRKMLAFNCNRFTHTRGRSRTGPRRPPRAGLGVCREPSPLQGLDLVPCTRRPCHQTPHPRPPPSLPLKPVLTSESSSASGAGPGAPSGAGLGGAEEGAGDADAQEGESPSSRAGKAARPTSSSGMSPRLSVRAASSASFSLSMICGEQRTRLLSAGAEPRRGACSAHPRQPAQVPRGAGTADAAGRSGAL